MALLKALVIGMGILIVAAMGLLAYGLVSKTSGDKETEAPAAMGAQPFAMEMLGDIVIPDAETCRIVDAGQRGATMRLTLDGEPSCRRLVLIDLTTGEITAQIRLAPEP